MTSAWRYTVLNKTFLRSLIYHNSAPTIDIATALNYINEPGRTRVFLEKISVARWSRIVCADLTCLLRLLYNCPCSFTDTTQIARIGGVAGRETLQAALTELQSSNDRTMRCDRLLRPNFARHLDQYEPTCAKVISGPTSSVKGLSVPALAKRGESNSAEMSDSAVGACWYLVNNCKQGICSEELEVPPWDRCGVDNDTAGPTPCSRDRTQVGRGASAGPAMDYSPGPYCPWSGNQLIST